MENPNTWTDVEKTIDEALTEWNKYFGPKSEKMLFGSSLPHYIAIQLRKKGLISEVPDNDEGS